MRYLSLRNQILAFGDFPFGNLLRCFFCHQFHDSLHMSSIKLDRSLDMAFLMAGPSKMEKSSGLLTVGCLQWAASSGLLPVGCLQWAAYSGLLTVGCGVEGAIVHD